MTSPNHPARVTAACSIPFVVMAGMSIVIQPPAAQAAPCPATMNFSVGGVGDPASTNTPGVPAGPRTNVPWPASVDNNAVAVGQANLTNAVNNFRAQCPGSHVTVTGFSGGALIAGNWRDANPGIQNANVILVADPRANGGISSVLPSVPFWFTNAGPRPASPVPTSNVCRNDDFICNMGNPLQDPIHTLNTFIAWNFGNPAGSHGYTNRDVNPAPGEHVLPNRQAPVIPEVVKVPLKVPTPRQMSPIEPFVSGQVQKQWTPPAVARGTAARNVAEVVPPVVAAALPPQVGQLLAGIPLPH